MVYTSDLKSDAFGIESSNLSFRTKIILQVSQLVDDQIWILEVVGSSPTLQTKNCQSGGMVYTLVLETNAF